MTTATTLELISLGWAIGVAQLMAIAPALSGLLNTEHNDDTTPKLAARVARRLRRIVMANGVKK